jgi:hypothetical protein
MVFNTWSLWDFGFCPLNNSLQNATFRSLDSVSVFRWYILIWASQQRYGIILSVGSNLEMKSENGNKSPVSETIQNCNSCIYIPWSETPGTGKWFVETAFLQLLIWSAKLDVVIQRIRNRNNESQLLPNTTDIEWCRPFSFYISRCTYEFLIHFVQQGTPSLI